jgi:sortase (surface protein transpeptidase)
MDIFKIFILRWLGNFLVLGAVAAVFLTFAPVIRAELLYRTDKVQGITYVVAGDEAPSTNLLAPQEKILPIEPLSRAFGIVIPKLGANAKVIANVNPGDYNDYINALKLGVAHSRGTVYPGQIGNTYLFAHSVVRDIFIWFMIPKLLTRKIRNF